MSNRPYDKSERVDLSDEPVHWDLGTSPSYGGYLRLDQILTAQRPLWKRSHTDARQHAR